jgi:hypothetical protein
LTGRHERGDPLNQPRVTLGGLVERCAAPRAKVRYLQRNPKSGLYAGFADFALFQLRIDDVHFNGGFGRAAPLAAAEILSPREGETALVAAEEGLLAEVNARRTKSRGSGAQGFRGLGSRAGGRSGSTPRGLTLRRGAEPLAPSSRRRRMTRRHGGRVSQSCSPPVRAPRTPIRGGLSANKRE